MADILHYITFYCVNRGMETGANCVIESNSSIKLHTIVTRGQIQKVV